MKNTVSIICLFVFSVFYTQKISVLDAETQKPIPYAKLILKGKDYYRNTEENGEITLEKDEKVSEIQSFGYENLLVQENKAMYFLKPKVTEIKMVEIVKPKQEKTFTEGKIGKSILGFGSSKASWIVVSFFPFKEEYNTSRFLKSIRFAQNVRHKKKAKIKLVFYRNENGSPSEEVWKSYIVECSSKGSKTEFVLDKPFVFPSEGVFIGFEWILNEENFYKENVTYIHQDGTKESKITENLNPTIKAQQVEKSNVWCYNSKSYKRDDDLSNETPNYTLDSKWFSFEGFKFKNKENAPVTLSLELVFTN